MQLPNGSSSQHAQSLSNTYGSPQNVARRLKVIDLMNISSTQHAQSTPYVTATGPSTQPVSHTPSSACTSNTDAMYSPTETEEQDPLSSTASYYTAEETSGLRQQHLELRCRGHHNARALGPAITLPFSYKPYDGHGKALRSENTAILIFGETMKPGLRVWNVEGGRPKRPQTLDLGLPCSLDVHVHAESPPWMKIMSQATCGETASHARVSQGHTLDIQSGDG
ncbi:hypothetical protein LV164_008729 [Aspergillus fumigatus]|nr:hypothetical protein KXX49_006308 [Aspergillus fumigatus]KAH1582568.1 hypothetical protein KXX69_002119 [Aspergillus fumigatus]KAH1616212.1 hypothetical protein KXX31_001879 [Aspergillus fumigatus]KAH2266943.1 hypothetical protein KXW02_003760 [Aspergillus fumigatus]KAH2487015.1 hypothetical protein KXV28_008885 [Aspergillus fumigatus]